jgi:hypothetical protein
VLINHANVDFLASSSYCKILFGVITFSPMNYRPMSFCPHELPFRPKNSIKLQFLHTLPTSVRNPVKLDGICNFFSVNFDLKTKMPFTVINKKILKLIYLKKKLEGKEVAVGQVAGATVRGGSRASHDLPPLLFLKVFFYFFY